MFDTPAVAQRSPRAAATGTKPKSTPVAGAPPGPPWRRRGSGLFGLTGPQPSPAAAASAIPLAARAVRLPPVRKQHRTPSAAERERWHVASTAARSEALNGPCLAAAAIGGGLPVVAEHPGGPFSGRIRLTDEAAATAIEARPASSRRRRGGCLR